MITRPMPPAYDPDNWLGRSGKASYYPQFPLMKVTGGQVPAGALQITGGSVALVPVKPRLMMDPSDPTTWQRQYQFTGGQIGGAISG